MINRRRLSRRVLLGGGIGLAGLASNLLALPLGLKGAQASSAITKIAITTDTPHTSHTSNRALEVPPGLADLPFMNPLDPLTIGFDPSQLLVTSDPGKVSKLASGQTLREFTFTATNRSTLVVAGQQFAALAINDQVPGPTIRATQGDHIRINFTNNSDTAIGINFTGLQSSNSDALLKPVAPNTSMVYDFDAGFFGLYLYQGFKLPLAENLVRGLYGMLIIDPPTPRPKATELFMILNGFVLGGPIKQPLPRSNDVYAINTVAYHYIRNPISGIAANQLVRVYLANVTEFDLLNSFHLHGTVFNIYRSGTSLKPEEAESTIMLGPGQRAILEFTFKLPGQYMFHAYQGEFADLGCMGIFNVQ
jgi:FtsP/CotA-like multicopper oxidase with cupredoxin domain